MNNAETAIRVDYEVKAALVEKMHPQESFNATLRRILKLDRKPARIGSGGRES